MGDVGHGLGASLGRATEFKQAKLAPTFAVLAAVGLLLAFAPSALAVEGGQITGKVTGASSKAAIAGIEVCAAESLFEAELFGHCAKTSSSGEYSISGLSAGKYGVGFVAPEGSGLNYITQYYNDKHGIGEAELFAVEAGKTVSGINAAMEVGGQITGKVTSATSKAGVGGIQVCASLVGGEAFGCAKTGSGGEYAVSGLPTGSYTVNFFSPEGSSANYLSQFYDGKSSYGEASPVSVTAGSTTSGINASLQIGGQISGKVTDASSKAGIQGIEVCAYESGAEFIERCVTTGSSGEYTITALTDGSYTVYFSSPESSSLDYISQYYNAKSSYGEANPVPVTAGSTSSGVNASLQAGGEITGKVTSASTKAGLEGVRVCAYTQEGEYREQCATSHSGGEYILRALPTGQYTVSFSPGLGENYIFQYYNNKSANAAPTPVSVTSGVTLTGIDAAMVVGGQITGKVTNAAGSASVANVQIAVYEASGTYAATYATTNSSGEYTVSGLHTGEYKVQFTPEYGSGNYLGQYYKDQSSLEAAAAIAVTVEKTTSEINAKLQTGGQITGKVTNASTKADLEGIEVCPSATGGIFYGQCATTNSSGEYTIIGLATGEYKVEFYSNSGANFVTQYYNAKSTSTEGNAISVTAGATSSGINAAMVVGGQITGKVTSATTKTGLGTVNVCATSTGGGLGGCATTNASGEYTIVGLATGEYRVEFSMGDSCGPSGCTPPNYLAQYYNVKSSYSEAEPVSVTAGATTSGIDAAMVEGGRITGKVTNSASKATVEGIQVCPQTVTGGYVGQCTATNSSGEYTISGLSPGEYKIEFYSNGGVYFTQYYNGKTSVSEASVVAVSAASTTSGIDAAMVEGGRITGKVTSAASKAGIAGVEVCAETETFFGQCATTNASGEYTLSGLAGGEYSVRFEPSSGNYLSQYYNAKSSRPEATLVSVADSTTTSGISAALAAGGQIKGTATSAATKAAIANIEACAESQSGEFFQRCATTTETGEYFIEGLPAGEYVVSFSPRYESGLNYLRQFYKGKALFAEAIPVAVTAGSTISGVDAAMAAGGQITGKVSDAASKAAIKGIQVCATHKSEGEGSVCATTGLSGEYTLMGLGTGEYTVEFSVPYGSNLEYVEQYYNSKSAFSEASPVSVTAGATKSGIDAAMLLKGQITGEVTGAATKASLAGIQVTVYQATNSFYVTSTTTNASGAYSVVGLAAGEYKVEFSVPYGSGLNYLPQYYNNKESLSAAGAISVSIGTVTKEINAAMAAGGEITGKVTNASTKSPVGGIEVCPSATSGLFYGQCATTNASGDYTLVGLPTGEYKVEFYSNSGANFVTQYYNAKPSVSEANAVSATAGATTSGINAAMVVGGKITGKVTDVATSAALSGIQVCAQPTSGPSSEACATTNSKGEYTIVALGTREYRVQFSVPYGSTLNYLPQYYNNKESSAEANLVPATAGSTTSAINAAMIPGGKITGKVTDAATKEGLNDVEVCLEPPNSTFYNNCRYTNTGGEYTFAGLATGEYKIEFEPFFGEYSLQYYNNKGSASEAVPVSVTAGATTPGINAAMVKGGEISGTVTSATSSTAIDGVQVCAEGGTEHFRRCATTNSSGEYTIVGLATGEYKVEFAPYTSGLNYLPQYYDNKSSATEATLVSATSGSITTGINAKLQAGGEITGKVTSASTKAALGGITVCPEAAGGGIGGQCATTNLSGEYTIVGLATGAYKVEFYSSSGANYVPQLYNGKSTFSEATSVSVTAGSTTLGINAEMVVGGQIAGKVTNATTKAAISGIEACAQATESTFFSSQCATTNSNGEYRIGALGTGKYTVYFYPNSGQNYLSQYYNDKPTFPEASAISVAAGSTTSGIDAPMIVGGQITGKVTEASTKAAIAGIEVCSSPVEAFSFFNHCTTTNAAGEYTIVALTTGEYDVRFHSTSNSYATQYYNIKTSLAFANAVSVTTGSTTSAVDAELANLPTSIAAPTIAGTAQQGHTLTETHGSWTNSPTKYSEQWERCNSTGNECIELAEATKQTYVPVPADVGHTLRVTETASNPAGSSTPAVSAPTAVVLPLPPVNIKTPVISGVAQQGKTLKEEHGTWENNPTKYEYEWLRCNEEGKSCSTISAATAQSYVPVAADVGHTLQVKETASNAGGAGTPAVSATTTVVVPPVPVNIKVPTVSGSAVQGQTLTEEHGTWENNPTAYEYQWQLCNASGGECAPISGAADQSYVLTGADVGHTIRVQETARNAGGSSTPAVSAATAKVAAAPPVDIEPPSISGTVQQGQTLTEAHDTWRNEPTSYTYQWLRCNEESKNCAAISGATEQTYVPGAADVGHTLEVQETAENAGGPSSPATSAATAVVVPPVPVNIKAPTITGNAVQGQTLTEVHGTWESNPTKYEYQWLRCNSEGKNCTAIAGATEQTYLLVTADVGHTLEVQETAINAGGTSQPTPSVKTGVVAAAKPTSITPPTTTGTTQQGKTLTDEHGTWTNEPTSYEYQWLRCNEEGKTCTAISGATTQTYQMAAADVGHTVEVSETARNAAGASTPTTSQASSVVLPAVPVNVTPPKSSGTAQQGQALTETHGTWTNNPTKYEYQWLRCEALGAGCLPIAGATGQAYTPVAEDVGHTLVVQETASNAGGTSENSAPSNPTALVKAAAPVNITPPSITGSAQKGQTLVEQHGTWTNEPTGFTYEWLRCSKEGTECKAITGAVDQTYLSTVTDVGHTLKVNEIAINHGGPSAPTTSEATASVQPIPLQAVAGESVSTTAGVPVSFDGSGSTPSSELEKYSWEFGDGSEAEGESVSHTYAAPGTYTAKLTITRGTESTNASVSVTVAPAPTHTATVDVTDSGHNPLSGATVLYIGPGNVRIEGVTGGDGKASLAGLPAGTDTVYAYRSGFQPAVGHVTVSGEEGETTIALASGEIAASTLKSHEMNLKEIEEAGININDPANQNVYEFEVRLAFIESPQEPIQLHCFINSHGEFVGSCTGGGGCCGGGGGGGGGGWGGGGGGGGGGPSCSPHECVGGGIVAVPEIVDGKPLIQWLILRGKASVLKQFFEVSEVVQNLSPEPFKLAAGTATLNVPPGMSLAPTAKPQTATQSVAAIPGNGSAETTWVVRGDKPGEYFLSADYHSKLEPFEAPVELEARLASPLKVWGVEALSLSVKAEEGFLAEGQPYHVRVSVTNKADITLNNVEIAIFANVHEHFIFQPDQRFSEQIAELKPGETISAPLDILVPDAPSEAEFNPSLSSVHFVGEEIHPGLGIETLPSAPLYQLVVNDESASKRVHLTWAPDPKAEGYEVFSTPTLDTPFSDAPEQVKTDPNGSATTVLPADATEAYAPYNSDAPTKYYAVASIIDGKATLDHPVVLASFGSGAEDWGYCFTAGGGIAYGAVTATGTLCLVQSGDGAHAYLMAHGALGHLTVPSNLNELHELGTSLINIAGSCAVQAGASVGAIAFEGPEGENPGLKTYGAVKGSVNVDLPLTHIGATLEGAAFQSRDLSTFGIYYGGGLSFGLGCLPFPLSAEAEPEYTFESKELTGALRDAATQTLATLQASSFGLLGPGAALGAIRYIGPPAINLVKKYFPGWYVSLSGATQQPAAPSGVTSWTYTSSSSNDEVATVTTPDDTLSASGRGIGSLAVGRYDTVPQGVPALGVGSTYFDAATSTASLFDPVTITDCDVTAGATVQWLDGHTWQKVSDAVFSSGPPECVTITVGTSTSPTLSQLTGTVFAVTPAPACTASPVIEEQPSSGTVTAPAEATLKAREGVVPANCSPASIQWQLSTDGGSSWSAVSGANFVGPTSATLRINSTATGESGHQFRAVLSNAHGETDSATATLTVNEALIVNEAGSRNSGGSAGTSPTNSGSSGTSGSGGVLAAKKASGSVLLAGSTIIVQSNGEAAVRLSCVSTTACAGKLTLAAKSTTRKGKKKHTRSETIGTAIFSIPAGKTAIVKLTITGTGRALLGAAYGRLSATLTIVKSSPSPINTQTKSVRLAQQKAIKAKKGKK
jgi:hypothetical protein